MLSPDKQLSGNCTVLTSLSIYILGWSLTLAGTYNDDMAPDVEMRLSFPKKNGKADSDTSSFNKKNTFKQDNGNYQNYQREQSDISNENYNSNNRAALPTAGSGNINPKRTLSKAVIGMFQHIIE